MMKKTEQLMYLIGLVLLLMLPLHADDDQTMSLIDKVLLSNSKSNEKEFQQFKAALSEPAAPGVSKEAADMLHAHEQRLVDDLGTTRWNSRPSGL